jgi:hypothetical protein
MHYTNPLLEITPKRGFYIFKYLDFGTGTSIIYKYMNIFYQSAEISYPCKKIQKRMGS